MRVLIRALGPERTVIVTDALACAGLRDAAFSFGGQQARVVDGVAKLADGTLTGSVLTMDRALALLTRELGLALPAAVGMLTRNPARAARVGERKGALDADLLIFDADLRLQATFCRGALAYATPAWQERYRHALG
jgi:N-acetylglucosamine-6-phosphate deacetylase